jgi:hypothetical protein
VEVQEEHPLEQQERLFLTGEIVLMVYMQEQVVILLVQVV